MTRRSKDIGTAAETATVRYIVPNGFGTAERRALRGQNDAGDITGTPGVAWSVKGGKQTLSPPDKVIQEWVDDLRKQIVFAKADVGVLVLQRHGKGPANAGLWWAYVTLPTVVELITNDPYARPGFEHVVVRMHLQDAVLLLRHAGYGDQLTAEAG